MNWSLLASPVTVSDARFLSVCSDPTIVTGRVTYSTCTHINAWPGHSKWDSRYVGERHSCHRKRAPCPASPPFPPPKPLHRPDPPSRSSTEYLGCPYHQNDAEKTHLDLAVDLVLPCAQRHNVALGVGHGTAELRRVGRRAHARRPALHDAACVHPCVRSFTRIAPELLWHSYQVNSSMNVRASPAASWPSWGSRRSCHQWGTGPGGSTGCLDSARSLGTREVTRGSFYLTSCS